MKFRLRPIIDFLLPFPLTVLLILVMPFMVLAFLPIYLLRLVVGKVLRPLLRSDLSALLPLQSSFLAVDDPYRAPKWNIVVWLVFEGNQDGATFFQMFKKRAVYRQLPNGGLEYPEFQQYYYKWLGFFFWKQEANFDADEHMGVYPDTGMVDEREFQGIFKNLTWAPFKKNTSPWEILWVNNYKQEASEAPKTVMILRVHHALCDGLQILNLIMDNCFLRPFATKVTPNAVKQSRGIRAWDFIRSPVAGPYQLVKSLVESYDVNQLIPRDGAMSFPFNNAISPSTPLKVIKDIKNAQGVSFNAVVLAAITGGLRRLMLKQGFKVPAYISAGAPMPLRNHPGKMTNYWTSSFLRLPVGTMDPLRRLQYIEGQMRRAKSSFAPQLNYLMMSAFGGLCYGLTKHFNKNNLCSMCISTFPGPTEYLTMTNELQGGKYKVVDIGFAAGNGGGENGLGFFIMTYGEHLKMTAEVENRILPTDDDVHLLNRFILHEISQLQELSCV